MYRWFKSPDLNPICFASPDERVKFSARQNAVFRAVEAGDRLDHIVSKEDVIICPMLSPRLFRSPSLRPAGRKSLGQWHPRLADDGLSCLWESKSKPPPHLDAEANFGEGISVSPLYFRSAFLPFPPWLLSCRTRMRVSRSKHLQTFISSEMKESLYFATQCKTIPTQDQVFRNVRAYDVSRGDKIFFDPP